MDFTNFQERNSRYQKSATTEVLKDQRDNYIVELRKAKRINEAIKRRKSYFPKSFILPPNLVISYPKLQSQDLTEKLSTINELILNHESLSEILNYLLITLEPLNEVPCSDALINNLIPLLSDSYISILACDCICDIVLISSEDCISDNMVDDLLVAFNNRALRETVLVILCNYLITKRTQAFTVQKIIDIAFNDGVNLDQLPMKLCKYMSRNVNYLKVAKWAFGLLGTSSQDEAIYCVCKLCQNSKKFKSKAIMEYFITNKLHIHLLECLDASDKSMCYALKTLNLLIKEDLNIASSLSEVKILFYLQKLLTHLNIKVSLNAFTVLFSLKISDIGSYLQDSYARYIIKQLVGTDLKKQKAAFNFIERMITCCNSCSSIFISNGLFKEMVEHLDLNDLGDDYINLLNVCQICISYSNENVQAFNESECLDFLASLKYIDCHERNHRLDELQFLAGYFDGFDKGEHAPAKFEFS